MISGEDVKHIAKLARLELSENEIKKMQKELSDILNYFDLLKKAPAFLDSEKEPVLQENLESVREDQEKHSQSSDEIVSSFPNKKDDYIKVKNIL
ncbi:MAG: Asp-tRNA(Asn)/Glu-tRNA(Gln) amidotransferase subunit GatC [archaeon]|jgi:aspartyl-tRNA(Asn)/glutamyl-tRNA(Gln) amidotransferase subunit C